MATFNDLVGALDYPMLIVTAAAGDERDGCLVGFSTQTSIHPSRFLACLSRKNRTYRIACAAEHLAVHVVPADAEALAEIFGGETADEVDKLSRVDWREGPGGAPVLNDCPNWFVGRLFLTFLGIALAAIGLSTHRTAPPRPVDSWDPISWIVSGTGWFDHSTPHA